MGCAVFVDIVQSNIKPPSITQIKTYINAVMNLKTSAMSALLDITHLKDRKSDHKDVKTLDYHRVTLSSVVREEFSKLPERAQEVYMYRLAR